MNTKILSFRDTEHAPRVLTALEDRYSLCSFEVRNGSRANGETYVSIFTDAEDKFHETLRAFAAGALYALRTK